MNKTLSISERLAYSTIRIVASNDHQSSTGTGFFFVYDIDGKTIPVIVTNKHVIENASALNVRFTIKDKEGFPDPHEHYDCRFEEFQNHVINHPDPSVDLCLIPFGPATIEAAKDGKDLFYVPFSQSIIPSSDVLENELNAIEEVIMVGYPNGLWDEVNNFPIVRKGITATHPKFNYNGKEEIVIDAACFPGSSGSPVFILNEGGYHTKNGSHHFGVTRVLFLGILYAGPQITASGEIKVVDIPTNSLPIAATKMMMNLGYVIKASKLMELEDLVREALPSKQ